MEFEITKWVHERKNVTKETIDGTHYYTALVGPKTDSVIVNDLAAYLRLEIEPTPFRIYPTRGMVPNSRLLSHLKTVKLPCVISSPNSNIFTVYVFSTNEGIIAQGVSGLNPPEIVEIHKHYELPDIINYDWVQKYYNTPEGTNFSLYCLTINDVGLSYNIATGKPQDFSISELYNLL